MSLARQISTIERYSEVPRPTTRPVVRKAKRNLGSGIVATIGWVTVLALSFFVVYRNTLVLAETNALTAKQEALSKVEQQIQEKSSKVNVSIEEVEKWAAAHNMKRPTTVKTAAADPNAAAPLPQNTAVQAASVAEPSPVGGGGLYAAIRDFFTRFSQAKAATGQGGN